MSGIRNVVASVGSGVAGPATVVTSISVQGQSALTGAVTLTATSPLALSQAGQNIDVRFNAQSANTVLAGPTSGGAAAPAFRQLGHAELSGLSADDHGQYLLLAPASSTRNIIQPTSATIKPLIVRGAASQSGNLTEWQNSAGSALVTIDSAGKVGIGIAPSVPLHVYGGTGAGITEVVRLVSGGMQNTGEGAAISFWDYYSGAGSWKLGYIAGWYNDLTGGTYQGNVSVYVNSGGSSTSIVEAGRFRYDKALLLYGLSASLPVVTDADKALTSMSYTTFAGNLTHGNLAGLSADDHPQYALLAGRSGGQTLKGDTASGGNLTLMSTANATKGLIAFGTSAYDEANNRLGLGTTSPASRLHMSVATGEATRYTNTSATGGVSTHISTWGGTNATDFLIGANLLYNGSGNYSRDSGSLAAIGLEVRMSDMAVYVQYLSAAGVQSNPLIIRQGTNNAEIGIGTGAASDVALYVRNTQSEVARFRGTGSAYAWVTIENTASGGKSWALLTTASSGTSIAPAGNIGLYDNTNGGMVWHANTSTHFFAIGLTGNNDIGARLHLAGNSSTATWGTAGIQVRADAQTYTDSGTAGTRTWGAAWGIAQPTYAGLNAVTITNAATLYIENAPAAGSNMTLTNKHALAIGNSANIAWYGSSSGFVGFKAPATVTASGIYTLPDGDGTGGQVLSTNGSGVLSWVTASGSGTVTGSGTATRIAFWSSSSALSSDAALYWDNTNKRVGVGTTTPGADLNVYQPASGTRGILLSGNDITGSAATTAGVLFSLGYSASGNRQLWLGDSAQYGSASYYSFRYILGFDVPIIDGVRNDGAVTANIIIGQSGKSVGIGWDAGTSQSGFGGELAVKGTVRLYGSTSGYVGLKGAAAAGSTVYTLPASDGSNGYVLTTNGSAVLSWAAGGSGTVTGTGTATRVAFWSGSSALSSSANLYWDNTNARLSVGAGSSPTGQIHLAAGASGAGSAPIKLTAGTNMTTAEDGAVEYDGKILFFTPKTTRHGVALARGGTLGTAVANSVTDTTIFSQTVKSNTLAAGMVIRITAGGWVTALDSSRHFDFKLKIGTTVIHTITITGLTTTTQWEVRWLLYVNAIGAGGDFRSRCVVTVGAAVYSDAAVGQQGAATTADVDLKVNAQWSTLESTSPSNDIEPLGCIMELLGS